jgi:hypothetical protein
MNHIVVVGLLDLLIVALQHNQILLDVLFFLACQPLTESAITDTGQETSPFSVSFRILSALSQPPPPEKKSVCDLDIGICRHSSITEFIHLHASFLPYHRV